MAGRLGGRLCGTARWSPVRKLWMARWKSACCGGQHGLRCGHFVDSERILKLVPETLVLPGFRAVEIRHCRRRAPRRGQPRNAGRTGKTGASSGCLVPAAGRLTKTPAGQPAGQRPKTGPGPCISYMRGPGLFPGPAHSGLGPSPGPSHSWPGLFRVGPFPSLAHSRPGPIPGPAHPGHYRTSHGNVTGHPDAAKSAATVTRGTSRPLAGGSTAGRRVNGGPTAR